jgi:hypothetical protein
MQRYDEDELAERLLLVGLMIDDKMPIPKERKLMSAIKQYRELSAKATTNIGRREDREQRFIEAIDLVRGSRNGRTQAKTGGMADQAPAAVSGTE